MGTLHKCMNLENIIILNMFKATEEKFYLCKEKDERHLKWKIIELPWNQLFLLGNKLSLRKYLNWKLTCGVFKVA